MSGQLYTILGTLLGASIGLLAPLVSAGLASRSGSRASQKAIADEILRLFEGNRSPLEIINDSENADRRKLYLLALRLKSKDARRSCMELIAHASESSHGSDDVLRRWEALMAEVSKIYTQG